MEDSALVLFLTPQEKQFVKDLIDGKSWRGKKADIFPCNTPIIKVGTELDSPLASIDLLIKMYVLFNDVAKASGDEPCKPMNPYKIDKRFPKSTPFQGM